MKCNLSYKNIISKNQREKVKKYVMQEAAEYLLQENANCLRRAYKLIAINLNEEHGFGKKRITDLFTSCGKKALEEREHDEIFWKHVDDIVINQIGLDFSRENYEEMDI